MSDDESCLNSQIRVKLMIELPATITTEEIAERYEAVLLDSSGVLVNEQGALEGASEFLELLQSSSIPYLVVTNDASRLPESAARRYQRMGLSVEVEQILSSGMLVADHLRQAGLDDQPACVLGTREARQFLVREKVPLVEAGDDRARSLIVADTGDYDFVDAVEKSISMLLRALREDRPLELVCPNPDLLYPSGPDSVGFTAGAIVALIEASVRSRFPGRPIEFTRLGKPHPALFERAVAILGTRKVVMVGDQLQTDIRGACDFGVDSVLLTRDISDVAAAINFAGQRPTFMMKSL